MKKVVVLSSILIAMLMMNVTQNIQACHECDEQADTTIMEVNEPIFESDIRYPQTIIHSIVTDFLNYPTSITQTKQKVLVLGYDGFQEETLQKIMETPQGGVSELAKQGGLYHSYAGADGEQETSTAPGWLTILSGQCSHGFGVVDNGDTKPQSVETFLSSAIEMGYSSTFISSWAPHFETTYREDIQHPENEIAYVQTANDEHSISTLQTILQDESSSAYDVIFATLEYTDQAGHANGYGNSEQDYVDVALQADQKGYELLQTIQNRTTIDEEDWLIIITTDHGGSGMDHGGQRDIERNTWFVVNKDIVIN